MVGRAVRGARVGRAAVLVLAAGFFASSGRAAQVEPRAAELIAEFASRMAGYTAFRFVVEDEIDEVRDSGQKVQYTHRRTVTVRRPDRLLVRSVGDVRNRTLWKDGETVTLLDRDENVYVQIDDPGTIDQMMDLLLSRYGVSTPLADLLSSDLQAVLTRDVETGEVVGPGYVGERRFHHLAFTQAEIDWQVWLGDGEGPPLGKFVITYKNLPGEPQYTARLSEFYALSEVAEGMFHPQLPPGAERVTLHPLPESPPEGGGTGE